MKRHAVAMAALLLTIVTPALASTFAYVSFDDLVEKADMIVVARVVASEASWTESGRLIVTNHQLQVEETWAGRLPKAQLSVRTPGGEVGGFTVEAHGFPQFKENERVILFLSRDSETGTYRVEGHQLGHYRIVTRLDGVTLAVPQIEDGVRFVEPNGRAMVKMQSSLLGDFKAAVLKRAAQPGIDLQ